MSEQSRLKDSPVPDKETPKKEFEKRWEGWRWFLKWQLQRRNKEEKKETKRGGREVAKTDRQVGGP